MREKEKSFVLHFTQFFESEIFLAWKLKSRLLLRNGVIFQKRHIYETYEKAFQRVCGNLQCMNQSQFFVHFLHQPEHLQQKKNESKIPEKRPKKLTFCPTKKNKIKIAFSFRPRCVASLASKFTVKFNLKLTWLTSLTFKNLLSERHTGTNTNF